MNQPLTTHAPFVEKFVVGDSAVLVLDFTVASTAVPLYYGGFALFIVYRLNFTGKCSRNLMSGMVTYWFLDLTVASAVLSWNYGGFSVVVYRQHLSG